MAYQLLFSTCYSHKPALPKPPAQVLVETAMVSACGGLAFALSSLLKLSSYESFVMPLPVLLCAARNGGSAGRKAVRATFVLLAGKPLSALHCVCILSYAPILVLAYNPVPWEQPELLCRPSCL